MKGVEKKKILSTCSVTVCVCESTFDFGHELCDKSKTEIHPQQQN